MEFFVKNIFIADAETVRLNIQSAKTLLTGENLAWVMGIVLDKNRNTLKDINDLLLLFGSEKKLIDAIKELS